MAFLGIGELLLGVSYPPFTLGLSSSSAGGSSTSSTVTSSSVTAQAAGGSGQFEGTWTRRSGSTSIVPVSPNSLTTTFQATGMSVGTLTATFDCTVLDKVTGETKVTGTVTVTLTRGNPPLSVSSPAAIFVQTPSSGSITVSGSTSVSASGGSGSYTYTWSKSGDFTISPSGSNVTASRLLGPQGGVQGTVSCTVRDTGTGEQVTVSGSVVLINNGSAAPTLSISASPTSVSGYGNDGTAATEAVTFTVSGGVGPFSISISGGPGSALTPSGSGRTLTSQFAHYAIPAGSPVGATFTATVTDSGTGQTAQAAVSAVFYNFAINGPIN